MILANRKYSYKLPTTFGTSLDDHYHLMYSILAQSFQKEETKILICHYFKQFMYTDFQSELTNKPNSRNSYEYCTFEKSFVEVLDMHAPKKRKILHGNHKPNSKSFCSTSKPYFSNKHVKGDADILLLKIIKFCLIIVK